jgi:cell division protein FtsI/penicillin-binding protein 2
VRPRHRRRAATSTTATALAVLLATAGCSLFQDEPGPDERARAFLEAWARGETAAAAAQTDDPAAAQAGLDALRTGLGSPNGTLTLGDVGSEGKDKATARFTAEWALPAVAAPWRYDGTLPLVRSDDAWTVQWGPTDLHPQLPAGRTVRVVRELPERAALQDAAGQPLFRRAAVVTVGVEPRRVTDLSALATTLAAALEIDPADIVADVKAAKPTAFVPVITLRRADYEKVKPKIYDLPGTVFRSGERQLGPTARFAQPLLGRVGEATAEVLKEVGGGYRAGDQLGVSGLQRALNDQLTGTAGARIEAVPAATGQQPTVLGRVDGKPGTPVRTTLDRAVQDAADAAVATATTPAALVAVRPSTGEVLAVADNAAAPYDLALAGRFPPGSTFKVVTATALLTAGVVRPDSAVDCPASTVVYGKRFQNSDRFDLGRVPLRTAFAESCNTSFTQLSQRLDDRSLPAAAALYGVGSTWTLPVPAFGGSVPAPRDDTEKAADAIGQGRVEVSPLAMALVAAAVAKGGGVVPALVAGQPAAGPPPAGPPAAVLPALRDMMRAVVTDGTASALASVPGGPVSGKTGTAEYGTAVPPRSHAWFTGFRGDLAFAVFVQDGESSKTTAVPVARTFLTAAGRAGQ